MDSILTINMFTLDGEFEAVFNGTLEQAIQLVNSTAHNASEYAEIWAMKWVPTDNGLGSILTRINMVWQKQY